MNNQRIIDLILDLNPDTGVQNPFAIDSKIKDIEVECLELIDYFEDCGDTEAGVAAFFNPSKELFKLITANLVAMGYTPTNIMLEFSNILRKGVTLWLKYNRIFNLPEQELRAECKQIKAFDDALLIDLSSNIVLAEAVRLLARHTWTATIKSLTSTWRIYAFSK